MHIATSGARVIHDSTARAFEPQPLEPASEQRRKRRTLADNFQMLFHYPGWLFKWRHRLWWKLLSHKYLRLAAPLFLVTGFVSNVALATRPFYQITLASQTLFYAAAVLGFLPGLRCLRARALPAGFFLNLMTLRGLLPLLHVRWRLRMEIGSRQRGQSLCFALTSRKENSLIHLSL